MIRRPGATESRVLLVDLNNFARFPTLPVGLLVAVLRQAGLPVEVLSPLAVGVKGISRNARARPWSFWDERLRWWSATTPSQAVRATRAALGRLSSHQRSARGSRLQGAMRAALDRRPSVVLVSAYLMYHETVRALCALAAERGIPVILGGPAFHEKDTRAAWLRIPGLTGIYAGEAEGVVVQLLASIHGNDDTPFPGFTRASGPDEGLARPSRTSMPSPFPTTTTSPGTSIPIASSRC